MPIIKPNEIDQYIKDAGPNWGVREWVFSPEELQAMLDGDVYVEHDGEFFHILHVDKWVPKEMNE